MWQRAKRLLQYEAEAFLGLRYGWLRRRKNHQKKPLKLYWFRNTDVGLYNFGDELSAVLIWELFGYRTEWYSMEEAELVGVGSLLNYAEEVSKTRKKFWGTGFIKKEGGCRKIKQDEFLAVRGKLSAERLGLENVPLGDPGILADLVFPAAKKNGKIGVVAHYVDADLDIVKKIKNDKRFIVIDPLQRPAEVAKQISACKCIISSSLHGLIFADSYGVPNVHVEFSNKVTGGDYKFKDYCSGVGKTYKKIEPEDIFDDKIIKEVIAEYKPIAHKRRLQRNLVKAFPYK